MVYNINTGLFNDPKYDAPVGTIGVIETDKRTKFYVLDVDSKVLADANGKPKISHTFDSCRWSQPREAVSHWFYVESP